MGRRAVLEGVEQEPELLPGLLRPDIEKFEDPALDILAVDTDATSSYFGPVKDHVIGPCPDLARIGCKKVQVLLFGRREGVVHGIVPSILLVVLEQGKIDDPEEIEPVGRYEIQLLSNVKPELAQGLVDHGGLTCNDQQ